MLDEYGLVAALFIVALLFPFVGAGIAWILRPKRPDPIKNSVYECGMETIGDTWVQFRAQYYLFALIFVIFDIEIIFLFPIAIAFERLGLMQVFYVILFVVLLADGLFYAWKKNALEWQ